jgi:hypothetical protein
MSPKVLQTDISVDLSQIRELLAGKNYVHVSHQDQAQSENLIQISRKNVRAKDLIVALANNGFSLYKSSEGVSSFVFHNQIANLWRPVNNKNLLDHDDVVYTLSPASDDIVPTRLLVIFSSISGDIYQSSLRRHFEQNFASVHKYIPADTLVLRIADMGGVVGSFYMNTNFLHDNEQRISNLIRKVMAEHGIVSPHVVLYGTSKGATGALYHGIKNDLRFVAVDPIVSDEHYVQTYNDSHFTVGTFPENKEAVFRRLMKEADTMPQNSSVIYSTNSPQYKYIGTVLCQTQSGSSLFFFNSRHPKIKDHPDVGPNTINIAVMLMNMGLYDMSLGEKRNYDLI